MRTYLLQFIITYAPLPSPSFYYCPLRRPLVVLLPQCSVRTTPFSKCSPSRGVVLAWVAERLAFGR